jgi:hypothetical protein
MLAKKNDQNKKRQQKGRIILAKIIYKPNKWRRLFPPQKITLRLIMNQLIKEFSI